MTKYTPFREYSRAFIFSSVLDAADFINALGLKILYAWHDIKVVITCYGIEIKEIEEIVEKHKGRSVEDIWKGRQA